MAEFEGKVALVTGGTSGIGTAVAESFACEGAKVVLTGRREKEGNEIAEKINQNGGEAMFVQTDIQKTEDVKNMVAKTVEKFGRLDFAVNNAGVEQYFQPLPKQKEKIYDLVMNTNVKGVWLSLKEEIPAILETAGGGSVINMSSVFGVVGSAMGPLYSASKHAVIGMTKSVALEYAKQNVRVNAVLPAAIETPMIERFSQGDKDTFNFLKSLHPIGRVGRPEEVADACVWLCSDKASFVTGTSIRVDGGFTAQ